jgi:hypothetical protein
VIRKLLFVKKNLVSKIMTEEKKNLSPNSGKSSRPILMSLGKPILPPIDIVESLEVPSATKAESLHQHFTECVAATDARN